MKKILQLFSVAVIMLAAFVVFANPLNAVNWEAGTITVKGTGVMPPNAVNEAQKYMMARRSAVIDGYRQLAEAIKGVNVDAESTVENFLLTSDVVQTKVNALIQGAEVIGEREIPGGYEVTMRISMYGGSNSLADAVLPRPEKREDFPKPVQTVAPSMPAYDSSASVSVRVDVTSKETTVKPALNNNAIGGYTGLIVDCRKLNLKPVMSPVVKNDSGESIYGHKNLDPDYVVENGMASYTSNLESGTSRAGSNPLVVKAVKVENHNGNPVISTADANRVLIENQATGFLDKASVVFVQ